MTTPQRPAALDALPAVVTRYLAAHRVHDTAATLALFAPGASVADDGAVYEGTAAIEGWLDRLASPSGFTYTSTPTGAERSGPDSWTVAQRVEGDFPGGTVDLSFRFTLRGDLVERLVIEV
ncbi:nuclear transport factor 2 family protein [Streptomyces tremellae]|uniref:SnoaL-like domain-containing protein n=1 Tax=Streptomyces tremellae TaxID=1124239 RepID=A0ABP7FDU1_9ACTN